MKRVLQRTGNAAVCALGSVPLTTQAGETCRPLICYWLNSKLEPDRVREQVHSFAQHGYGGLLIIPGGGLPYQVMEETWLDAVGVILDQGTRDKLDVWIWDEWIFPSGTANGLVTENPEFWAKRLTVAMDVLVAPGETFEAIAPARMLSAGACPVDKHGAPTGPWQPLTDRPGERLRHTAGKQRERCVVVTWEHYSAHAATHNDRNVHSVDMLNAAATRQFIEIIHEQYARRFSQYFGNTLRGFFYDEPTLVVPFPWTQEFAAEFQKRKGRDLLPDLPALLTAHSTGLTDPGVRAPRAVRPLANDYLDVWTDLVAENFYGELETWCHHHGLLSIGHQDMDHRLSNLVTVSGHFFKNSARNDHPGVDVIFDQVMPGRFDDFPRYAGSAARVLGKQRALSESLSAMGWGMGPDRCRFVLEHQIARGINQFFLMYASYDPTRANPYPPELLPSFNPLLAESTGPLNDRLGRLTALFCAGRSLANIGLYLPLYTVAAEQLVLSQPHTGNHSHSWTPVDALAQELTYSGREFDYLWHEGLLALEVTAGGLRSRAGNLYTTIILPPDCQLAPADIEKLTAFAGQGGRILTQGRPPQELAKCAIECAGVNDIIAQSPRQLTLDGANHPRVSVTGRAADQRETWLLLNEDTQPVEATASLPGAGRIVELDRNDGRLTTIVTGESLRWTIRLAPTESRVFLREAATGDAPPAPEKTGPELALRHWTLTLPDGRQRDVTGAFPDWCALGFASFTGSMEYRAEFDWPAGADTALLDLGEVCCAALVQLDDRADRQRALFSPFRVRLAGLTPGRHVLKLRVFNTEANAHCGDPLTGYYWPRDLDRQLLKSGLFGPIRLTPLQPCSSSIK